MKHHLAPFLLAALACSATATNDTADAPALKDVFKADFLIGAALNASQFTPSAGENGEVKLIQRQFNSITPENVLKWGLSTRNLNATTLGWLMITWPLESRTKCSSSAII